MANAKNVLMEQIEQLSAPVLREHGAELVDLQFLHEHGQWVLRFFLDKPGGIMLDDCAKASNHLSQVLDAADLVVQSYALEVSSPGLNRPLKKESDWLRFVGERVDVTLYAPREGRRHFRGTIQSVNEGVASIREPAGVIFTLPLVDMAKARLDPEINI